MLKLYKLNGATFQFEEGNQPPEAVEVVAEKADKPAAKAKALANKARRWSRTK